MKAKTDLQAGATPLPHPPTRPAPKHVVIRALRAPALALTLLFGLVGCGDASFDELGVSQYGAVYPSGEKHYHTFHAALCGVSNVNVISKPVLVEDDAGSNSYVLLMFGLYTEPDAGGSEVPGMTWVNGASYGGVSSEGYLHPTHVPARYWADNATLYAAYDLRDSTLNPMGGGDLAIRLRTVNPVDKATGKIVRFPASHHACQPRGVGKPAH